MYVAWKIWLPILSASVLVMDKRMFKKIARKALTNLDVDVASQALGQTEIAAKPVAHAWIPFNILPASF